jgi:hypothetical protein
MNTHLSGRTVCLLLAGCILAGSIQSAPVSGLTIERLEGSSVFLTWTNDGPDYVLQELNPLTESGRWQTVPEPRQLLKGQLGVTLSVQTNQHTLYENAAPEDWGDGGAITNPVWIAGTTGLPIRNVPACYTCSGTNLSRLSTKTYCKLDPRNSTCPKAR